MGVNPAVLLRLFIPWEASRRRNVIKPIMQPVLRPRQVKMIFCESKEVSIVLANKGLNHRCVHFF